MEGGQGIHGTRAVSDMIGAHMSIAGGLALAFERGHALRCGAVQIFVKSHRQWASRPLDADAVRAFDFARRRTGIAVVFAHASYLLNLAAPSSAQRRQTIDAFTDELGRAEALGLSMVVVHPGAHLGDGVDRGLARVVDALDEVTERTGGSRVRIALENTAGAGTVLGRSFTELGAIIARARRPERLGVCIDTCHLFAAGHDIRTAEGWDRAVAECEEAVGLSRVLAFHVNDAKADLGSGLDRHEHIGRGCLGVVPFRCLLNDPRFAGVPKVLETPKEPEPHADRRNLRALRHLAAATARASRRRDGTASAPGRSSTSGRAACRRSGRT